MAKLHVDEAAASWYKQELNLREGDALRFYVYLGGCGSISSGFSLGVSKEKPRNIGLSYATQGITFYLEEDQLWYLDKKDLEVSYHSETEEIVMKAV